LIRDHADLEQLNHSTTRVRIPARFRAGPSKFGLLLLGDVIRNRRDRGSRVIEYCAGSDLQVDDAARLQGVDRFPAWFGSVYPRNRDRSRL
jgi:hypothetical protein